MRAPTVPFSVVDGLVHRVAADVRPQWVKDHMDGDYVAVHAQCGRNFYGRARPIGSLMVTCLGCLSRELVNEADWEGFA